MSGRTRRRLEIVERIVNPPPRPLMPRVRWRVVDPGPEGFEASQAKAGELFEWGPNGALVEVRT